MRGVILRPGSPFQIRNAGWDASGLDAVVSRCEVILSEMYLGLDDGELIAEMSELVVLATESFDFSGGIPIVKVGDGAAEHVESRGWAVEKGVEPYGYGLSDVLG
jgi:hypothetical protein